MAVPAQPAGAVAAAGASLDGAEALNVPTYATFLALALFCLASSRDEDVRRGTWSCIQTAVSVLCASAAASGLAALQRAVVGALGLELTGCLQLSEAYACVLASYAALQLTTAATCRVHREECTVDAQAWAVAEPLRGDSGALVDPDVVRRRSGDKAVALAEDGEEVFVQRVWPEWQRMLHDLKGRGMLLSHIVGFAAMQAGDAWQLWAPFGSAAPMRLVAGAANLAIISPVLIVSSLSRAELNWRLGSGQATQQAGRDDARVLVWLREVLDTDSDIAGMVVSRVLAQALCLAVCGHLPLQGEPAPGLPLGAPAGGASGHNLAALLLAGAACLLGAGALVFSSASESSTAGRLVEVCQNVLVMAFAWCCIFSARLAGAAGHLFGPAGVPELAAAEGAQCRLHLAAALRCSCAALAAVVVLVLAPQARGCGAYGAGALRMQQHLAGAAGLLCGVPWAGCLLTAAAAAAAGAPAAPAGWAPLAVDVAFPVALLLFVLPAWRAHVVPQALDDRGRTSQARPREAEALCRSPGGELELELEAPTPAEGGRAAARAVLLAGNRQPGAAAAAGPVRAAAWTSPRVISPRAWLGRCASDRTTTAA